MSVFKPQYITALYIGEGLSGLIPGLIGLAQGVGADPICQYIINETSYGSENSRGVIIEYPPPNFSVEVFFFCLFALLLASCLAFTCLHFLPYCRNALSVSTECHFGETKVQCIQEPPAENTQETDDVGARFIRDMEGEADAQDGPTANDGADSTDMSFDLGASRVTVHQMALLLGSNAWINALTNGLVAATQSYSCLPYSNLAYTLTVRLSTLANPLGCLVALFVPSQSLALIAVLTILGSAGAGYQLCLAAMSPNPPLVDSVAGEVLVVSRFTFNSTVEELTLVTAELRKQREILITSQRRTVHMAVRDVVVPVVLTV